MVEERNLGHRFHLLPPVRSEDLPGITVAADMGFILFRNSCLNHFYSLPNKLYEYPMAGVPVIASGFPEIKKVLNRYDYGITVDPGSPSAIAAVVQRLAEDESLRRRLASNGRKAALNELNWNFQKVKLLKMYQSLQIM